MMRVLETNEFISGSFLQDVFGDSCMNDDPLLSCQRSGKMNELAGDNSIKREDGIRFDARN
jgi:hypothetical protein